MAAPVAAQLKFSLQFHTNHLFLPPQFPERLWKRSSGVSMCFLSRLTNVTPTAPPQSVRLPLMLPLPVVHPGTHLLSPLPTFSQPRRIISPKYCAFPFCIQSVFPSHFMRGNFSTVVEAMAVASEGDEARGIELPQRKLSAE